MSIADNIAFGLKIKNKPKNHIEDKIKYALKLVNLDGFENRSVDSLSGGQQTAYRHSPRHRQRTEGPASGRAAGSPGSQVRQDMQYELIRLKMSWESHLFMSPMIRKRPSPCPIRLS